MTFVEYLYDMAYYIGALLIAASSLLYAVIQGHTQKTHNRIYILMLVLLIIQSFQKIIITLATADAGWSLIMRRVLYVTLVAYHVMHFFLPLFIYYYALFATRTHARFAYRLHLLGIVPLFLAMLLNLFNPLTGWVYTLDSDYGMIWHWGEYVGYMIGAVYLFGTIGIFFRWGHAISLERKIILGVSFLSTIIGVVIKIYAHHLDVELFLEAITFLGLMLAVEYDEERIDVATMLYNRSAFGQDYMTASDFESSFYVVSIHFRNIEMVRRFMRLDDAGLIKKIADTLTASSRSNVIYRVTPSVFAIIVSNSDKEEARKVAENLCRNFGSDWIEGDDNGICKFTVVCAEVPGELSSVEYTILMFDSSLPEEFNGRVMYGKDLEFLFDRFKLGNTLSSAIGNRNITISYKPIYVTRTHEIFALESLPKLEDPILGEMSYNDFIALAERNGMVNRITVYTLREICSYLKTGEPQRKGVHYISLRLSMMQCIEPDFVQRFHGIVCEYGINTRLINLELTDMVDSVDHRVLADVIKELKILGYVVSLEGYGRGYTNMYTVFSMYFDIIKMDNSL
ncbi:MAG: EAL domain-containing protein, partial [Lachnospiraceae bacterium]|nr:EAL domain-containing protein [Lachnospiraceae bacterium]